MQLAPTDRQSRAEWLENARKVSNRAQRLAPRLGIAWYALRSFNGGPHAGQSRSPSKVLCKKLVPLTSAAIPGDAGSGALHDTDAAELLAGRHDALFALSTRSMSEVSLRVWRHACTHDSLTHHAAWTACQAHVLAGASNAVEHLESRKLWLDKSWSVAVDGGASRGAMVCHETACAKRDSASCMAPRMANESYGVRE